MSNPCKCQKCGGTNVAGLVAPFWTKIEADGTPTKRLRDSVESETEVGDERQCGDCGHEWQRMSPHNAAYVAKIKALEMEKENARLRLLIEEQKSALQWAKEIIQEQTLASK